MTILNKIIEYKKLELEADARKISLVDIKKRVSDVESARSFMQAFESDDIHIIAEIKKASPSAGVIRENFDPVLIAKEYEQAGASSLSVLTDQNFFQGSLDYLTAVKSKVQLPVLRKDFTIDEYHIYQARAFGADAVLLIVAALDDFQLKDYIDLIKELGMTSLVEVHNQQEYQRIQCLPLDLLGINNRNLKTFETSIDVTKGLLKNNSIPFKVVSESGLKTHNQLKELKNLGISAFLIGETLMRSDSISHKMVEIKRGVE